MAAREKGKTEGIREGIERVARSMLQQDMSFQAITSVTGLDASDLEKLKE